MVSLSFCICGNSKHTTILNSGENYMTNDTLKDSLKAMIKEAILEKRHQPSKDRPATEEDLKILFGEFNKDLTNGDRKEIENFFTTGPSVNALTKMFWTLTDPSGDDDSEKSLDYIGIR